MPHIDYLIPRMCYLLVPVLLPLLPLAGSWFLPQTQRRRRFITGALLFTILFAWLAQGLQGNILFGTLGWFEFSLLGTPLSAPVAVILSILLCLAGIFGFEIVAEKERAYYRGYLLLCSSIFAMLCAGSLPLLLVFWLVAAGSAGWLAARNPQAGRIYPIGTLLSGVLLLAGTGLTVHAGLSLSFLPHGMDSTPLLPALLVVAGFAVHAITCQLTPAHAPTSVALSAVLASADLFAATQVICHLYGLENLRNAGLPVLLPGLCLAAALVAGICAVRCATLNARIRCLALSQTGIILFGLLTLERDLFIGSMLLLLLGSLCLTALLLCCGAFRYTQGKTLVSELEGIGRQMPLALFCFGCAAFGLVGLPPFAGSVSRWYLSTGALSSLPYGKLWVLLLLVLAGLAGLALLVPLSRGFFPGKEYEPDTKMHYGACVGLPIAVLAGALLWSGIFPTYVLRWVESASAVFRNLPPLPVPTDFVRICAGSPRAVWLLALVFLLPLAGSVGVWAISLYGQTIPGNGWRDRRDAIIWGSCGLTLLAVTVLRNHWGAEFMLLGAGGISYSFSIDGLRYTLAVLVTLLWLLSSLFSRWYLAQSSHKMRYYFFFLLGEAAILTVLFSADLYTLLSGFVMLNLACWVLTGHRESEAARLAGNRALLGIMIGGLCALGGVLLLCSLRGTVRFTALQLVGATCNDRLTLYLAGGLILAGISIGCAVWPMPKRMPNTTFAPGPAAALLAGAVTVAWLFSAMVLSGLLFWWDKPWGMVLTLLGCVVMTLPAWVAMRSMNLKQTLSLLSVSQTGMILLTLGLNCLLTSQNHIAAEAVVLESLHHGLCQMVLFLCAGVLCMHQPDLSLATIAGFGRGKKALGVGFTLACASLCGMPLFFGSVNLTLLQKALRSYGEMLPADSRWPIVFQGIRWLLVLVCAMSVAALVKLLVTLFGRTNPDPHLQERYDRLNERGVSLPVKLLLVSAGGLLLLAGLTAPVTLRAIAYSTVGFFSTSMREPLSALTAGAWVLGALHLVLGLVLYLLLVRKPVEKQMVYEPET